MSFPLHAQVMQHLQPTLAVLDVSIALIPGIAGQNRADHCLHLIHWMRIEDHILKTSVIPGRNIGTKGGYAFFQGHCKVLLPVHGLTGQHGCSSAAAMLAERMAMVT